MLNLATNQYPWFTFYRREGRRLEESLDLCLQEIAASGLNGFEPIITAPEQLDKLAPLLKKHRLEMRSIYVGSALHVPEEAEASIEQVFAIAEKAKGLGAQIIVTNPSPLRGGSNPNKDDNQLITQAESLNVLGRMLAAMKLTLAYHHHDVELRNAACEFHHMMIGTDPKCVSLCLDTHWIYRGSGNSAIAVFDILKLYGPRITELHLRQSVKGIWTEAFGDGDIDYRTMTRLVLDLGVIRPHLVLEQCVEQASPHTMNAAQAHRKGVDYARHVFGGLAA